MKRVKRRTFAGVVCEQEVYTVGDRVNVKTAEPPRPRFRNDEERAQHREEISRRRHAQLFNENFTPASLYSTLTFDNDNEVFSVAECKTLRDAYVRRLKRKYPEAVIFIYYGEGKTTHRFHLHMVTNGIPAEEISRLWPYGEIRRIEHLRERVTYNGTDHGPDYTSLANYLFDHWKESYGGHRWKMTRNARRPDQEPPEEIKREYTLEKPPRPPKGYILVEARQTTFGYLYFKYVKKPQGRRRKTEKRTE